MKRPHRVIALVLLVSMLFTTGCWDAEELKNRAIVMGWGMDINDKGNGRYLASAEIVIPTQLGSVGEGGGGGKGDAYMVETATGANIFDATQSMQTKLSRQIFPGQRRAIFIGQKLAEEGLDVVIDEYTRNPEVRLRTDMFVVKGARAVDLFRTKYPLESLPVEGALKEHIAIGGSGVTALRDFLVGSSGDLGVATLPAITVSSSENKIHGLESDPNELQIVGTAIFKNYKLVGFFNLQETKYYQWLEGNLKRPNMTAYIPAGDGNVSLLVTDTSSKIRPSIRNGRIHFDIDLAAGGAVRENDTKLDMNDERNIVTIDQQLAKRADEGMTKLITRCQKELHTDVLGFGEQIRIHYPRQWQVLKKNWQQEFESATFTVHVTTSVERVGITSSSAQWNENVLQHH